MRYTPGWFISMGIDGVVKQQVKPPFPVPSCQAACPPAGTVSGKLTLIVVPTGTLFEDTESVPDGGYAGVAARETVTRFTADALPPRPSATIVR